MHALAFDPRGAPSNSIRSSGVGVRLTREAVFACSYGAQRKTLINFTFYGRFQDGYSIKKIFWLPKTKEREYQQLD